jgi:hypothetical protein
MRIIKIDNKVKELWREDVITIKRTLKGKMILIRLLVHSINGEVDQWQGYTIKDQEMLGRIRKEDGAGWDDEILEILNKNIPQP